ncbi:MAG: MFS transporter [Nocardioidaceae bacterium]
MTARWLLGVAAVAVMFAAADTYVVVLALPDMMTSVGLGIDQLQRAAPILSGFLLGYVGVLPLIGRIADLRGRTPVLIGSLVVFAIGSVVTAASYSLDTMVLGRFVQGVGGGGLVPATLALVADMWPAERRGLPLGVVGAVQELGSVLGPLYGAMVLSFGDWRAIFWLNMVVAFVLVAALLTLRRRDRAGRGTARPRVPDVAGLVLGLATLIAVVLVMTQPDRLVTDVNYGLAFLPVTGGSRWLTPVALTGLGLLVLFVVRQAFAQRPLLAWRTWGATARDTDLPGAALLAIALGGIIVAFASADPQRQVLAASGPWLLVMAAVAAGLFGWRQARAHNPLVPRGALSRTSAWGSVLVSLFVGSSLIAALVDIPFFARLTVYTDSQLQAALVLVRFLVALPVGALAGGWLTRRVPAGVLVATGMGCAAVSFLVMARWGSQELNHASATIPLVVAGLGFGLAIAPVNAVVLASTDDTVHGVASAFIVVARMVGMLVGISALTTIGLHRFYAVATRIPSVQVLCPSHPADCPAYTDRLVGAGLAQLHAVFVGAAVCALLAGVAALVTFRGARTRAGVPAYLEIGL